ncbi:MAG: alpha/beta hydrolase [Chloroflexi bacterium]|nr:alpha/beta hydrolase [Chloroflexota bacterium]MDA1002921.1 alpha/beta hydrolase [Chloroflexota bacterium]
MTKRHGVVVIHGQGDRQARGAMLAEFANPVVDVLRTAGNEVSLEFDGDAAVPVARMEVRRPSTRLGAGDEDHHLFELREAFWGDAFPPPSADNVTRWALGGLGAQIDGIRTGWWRNPTAAPSEENRTATREGAPAQRVMRRVSPEGPRALRWFYRLTLLFLTSLLMLLSVLTFLLLRPLAWFVYALAGTPGVRVFGLTTRIANGVAGLNPFLSRVLGDTERFVTDGAWALNVRARVERVLLALLDDGLDDITIVAYSAGAGVAYDVLLEGRPLARRLHAITEGGATPTPIRLVTVGSGIYHMWSFAHMDPFADPERRRIATGRIDRMISGVDEAPRPFPFWTDLFARFDFVAAGPIRPEIASLSGLSEGLHYRSHRVINYDHVTDDHFGYFRNKELAVPRIVAAIFGSARWMDEAPSEAAAAGAFTQIDPERRARSLFWLNVAKLLPLIALTLHTLFVVAWGAYRELCIAISDATVPGWAVGLWARVAEEIGVRPQFVVVGVMIFLFYSVLGRALYGWWRPKLDDGQRLGLRRFATGLWNIPAAVGRSVRHNAPAYAFLGLVLVTLAAASIWYYVPAQVRAGALALASGPHALNLEIVDAATGQVALSGARKNTAHPGRLGLQWDGGYGQVEAILREYDDRIVRRFAAIEGELAGGRAPLGPARIDTGAFMGDPLSARGVPFTDIEFAAPLGPQRAWVAGDGATWAIVVHGKGATREESLRILPTLVDLGLTAMAITYRNDRESIQDPAGEYEYGATEWRDLEAAVDYALTRGAADVVLYGYSMGGAITASFLERSDRAPHVRAVVLDAPMLDFASTVELGLRDAPLIGRFAPQLRVMTGMRLGIDWADLDYLDDDIARLRAPILLLHGDADDVVPIETSRRLSSLRPDLVSYHEFADAGHTREWNVDPERYEALVRAFLSAQLAR